MSALPRPLVGLLLAAPVALAGCPGSDDITAAADVGLSPSDALFLELGGGGGDHGGTPGTDTGGTPGNDTASGKCTSNADCAGAFVLKVCEAALCDQGTGKCIRTSAPDTSPCEDDNSCTVTACKGGVCTKVNDVVCDDHNACTADICNPSVGCQFTPQVGTPCDDGDPCTGPDKCDQGVCKPGAKSCDLGSDDNPAASCQEIREKEPAKGSGLYWVKGSGTPFQVWCDQTTLGGGWMRVARLTADVPVCSYAPGLGNPADVAGTGNASAILSATTVSALPFGQEVLIADTKGGAIIYRSNQAGFTWQAIASGAVNPTNVTQYQVQWSTDGETFAALNASPATGGKTTLLGGQLSAGNYAPTIGIGAFATGTFAQDAKCAKDSAKWPGLFYKSWGAPGTVSIR